MLAIGLLILMMTVATAEIVEEGKRVYEENCLACHGEKGDQLKDVGIDFSDPEWWQKVTEEKVREIILKGEPDEGMPAWEGVLTDEEIDAVIIYTKFLAGITPTPEEAPATPTPEEAITPTPEKKDAPGFEAVLALTAILYLAIRNKRNK